MFAVLNVWVLRLHKLSHSALKPCGLALLHFASTRLALQRGRAIRLPHGNILPTHGPAPSLLLRLVPVNVPHAHPSPAPQPASSCAHRPFGVILRGLEGDLAVWRDHVHVQSLPAGGAVGREDAGGATPELNQQVRLQRGSHPGMVQVWNRGGPSYIHMIRTTICLQNSFYSFQISKSFY